MIHYNIIYIYTYYTIISIVKYNIITTHLFENFQDTRFPRQAETHFGEVPQPPFDPGNIWTDLASFWSHFFLVFWMGIYNWLEVSNCGKTRVVLFFPLKTFIKNWDEDLFLEQRNQHTSICSVSSLFIRVTLRRPGRLGSNVAQLFPIPELETGWFDVRNQLDRDGPKFFGT